MERRLVAILAADMVGYSRLMEADEEGTIARQRAHRVDLIDPTIARHKGRIVKTMGDGLLIEFNSVVDAVRCAVEMQEAMIQREADLAGADRIAYRIGVNLGDIVIDGDDILGEGVNIAARLEALAEPGGICISDVVYQSVKGKLEIDFDDLGEQQMKNIAAPVRVHRITLGGPAAIAPSYDAAPVSRDLPEKPSIAVLPFANMSGDPEQEFFADGITEDIITGLSKNPDLFVISRNSMFTYKGKTVYVREVSETLRARYVLEGSVRKAGQRVRVTAQLIEAPDDRHLWAERYDRDLDDIFAVQDEVVGSIVHALGAADGALEKSARRYSIGKAVTETGAYDLYLQAREHFYRHGDIGFDEAESLYEKAIASDPNFARAYSALAWLHFTRFKLFMTETFESMREKALDLALQSIRLDPDDFRGHWVLGGIYLHEGKIARSSSEFDRALRINPNDANLLAFSTEPLIYGGHVDEALERGRYAIRLNPNCPDWYWWQIGFSYFHMGQYQDALDALEHMTEHGQSRRLLAATYAHLGRLEEARSVAKGFMETFPNFSISEWAKTEPYDDPKELQRFVDGLTQAGFPI